MSIIFLGGVYGVGKSTLGSKLSEKTGWPFYSAGDLISSVNGEKYGANKYVSNKVANQEILVECVAGLLQSYENLFLGGHFCILNRQGQIEQLPLDVYERLCISEIVLLEASKEILLRNLKKRDDRHYSSQLIQELIAFERETAGIVARNIQRSLFIHEMTYSDADVDTIINHTNTK